MKAFKQTMGALSRDMMFLHGHIVSIRGLDGAAQRSTYPTTTGNTESSHAATRNRATRNTRKGCTA